MSGLAALAVHEVALTSGLRTSLPAGITPSVIDGFAAGALLSGLCFLFAMAPRRIVRRLRPAAKVAKRGVPREPITLDLSGYASQPPPFLPSPNLDPLADESAEVVISLLDREAIAQVSSLVSANDPSSGKSRQPTASSEVPQRRPEPKRTAGRHAAPPVGVGSRVASKLALHPVAARQ
jgi:hypothetical protein